MPWPSYEPPAPAYSPYDPQTAPRPETSPLLGRHLSRANRARTTLWFLGLLVLPTVLFVIGNTAQSIQYSHTRSELGIAKTQLDATRTQLASVRAQREQEEAAWAVERAQRAEQRQREDADKLDAARRARMHLFWDKPQRGEHCARYGAREYSARLFNVEDGYDWVTACERTPVVIHDNVIAKPDWCHVRDGVWGHWIVPFQEPDCNAVWGREYDMGCIGERSGLRQIEARLDWVHRNENSYHLCTTAPKEVHGVHFDKPHHCFERDRFMWALWEVEDTMYC